jgi:putative endonuclease
MPYFVYLLQCKDGSIYTGITTDVTRRFAEHKNKKGGHYTASHGTRKMIYTEKYPNRSAALKREAEIKRWRREKKIKLIDCFSARKGLGFGYRSINL